MTFDGFMAYAISKELETCIIGGKIDKIFQPTPNEIILGIYSEKTKYALDIVVAPNNYRLCLTTTPKSNPVSAPNFCMLLRKYLLNTRIINVYTLGLERLIIIEFEGHNKSGDFSTKKLIIELMGKHSNIILVNSNKQIIDALKHFDTSSNSYRNIYPNSSYTLPISNKLDFFNMKTPNQTFESIVEYLKNFFENSASDDFNQYISNFKLSDAFSQVFTGMSKSSIMSFIHELNIEDYLTIANVTLLYDYLTYLLHHVPTNVIISDSEERNRLTTVKEKTSSLQINFYLDDYYSTKEHCENYINYRNNLSKLILNYLKKLNNKLTSINNKLKECQNIDLYRLYGELITNNLYRITETHIDYINIENYYDNNNIITIPLDKSITPSQNAKKYFKRYNKLKNAKEIVEKQKEDVHNEINYLESIIYELQNAKTIEDIDDIYNEFSENFSGRKNNIKSQKQRKKYNSKNTLNKYAKIVQPLIYQIENFTVLVGKNNKQNDFITKQANSDDIWFHTKDIHGSHVILKTNNQTPSQEIINKCAALAAFHSKASESDNVPVDYTYIKHVKKPTGAKPGMVIYTNHKNVIVKPNNAF